ncbi:hypothetical protein ALQ60_200217 [Pseudomonas syringae pv. papulans]|nr:hypothetical protein ALQ60_200217 [Pseudomonas syringae pv. papulans]
MQGCRLAIHFLIACEKMPVGAVFIEDRPVKLLPILLLALLPLTANACKSASVCLPGHCSTNTTSPTP